MAKRLPALLIALALAGVACTGDDAELSTSSTIVTGGTNAPTTTTTQGEGEGDGSSSTTLVGQPVAEFEVVARFPNDQGEQQYIVIPDGAYTDVDLENFVIDLIEANPDLFGAEIFDDPDAAAAFALQADQRSEEQNTLIEEHHLVTLVGRDSIEYRGPFAEFPGGAIGS